MTTWYTISRLVRYRPGLYLVNGALAILYWLMMLAPGLIARQFFDLLSGNAPLGLDAWGLIVLLIMLELGRVVVGLVWQRVELTFSLTLGALLRANLLAYILQRPGALTLPTSTGDAVSRFGDDIDDIVRFPGKFGVLKLVSALISNVVALVIMLHINARVTLLVFIPLASMVLVAQMASSRVREYHRVSRQTTGTVMGALGEVFGAVQAVKISCAEERIVRHIDALNRERRRAAVQDLLCRTVLRSLYDGTANVGTGLILLVGAGAMRTGSFTVGDFALFVYNLVSVSSITALAGSLWAQYKGVDVSVRRLTDLLEDTSSESLVRHNPVYLDGDPPPPACPARGEGDYLRTLDVTGLSYHYPSTNRGVRDIDLHLVRGSFTVVTGRVGSGKTTLLRALLGLLPKERGEVRWNGRPVDDLAAFCVPPRTAYTPQVPRLFSDTLKTNILVGYPEELADIAAAIHAAVMERDVERLAEKTETLVGPRGMRLSGGQVQRTAAARMFIREAELLVMDDLSSALDVETEQILWERLFARPGVTCLAVSHREVALRHASQIIILKDGRVDAIGTFDELRRHSAEMRALLRDHPEPPASSGQPQPAPEHARQGTASRTHISHS